MTEWFHVGKIVNTHGINGEVRVISETDFADERFQKGAKLYVGDAKKNSFEPLVVNTHRRHKQFDLLSFNDHPSINDVERFKGLSLYVAKEQLSELEEDAYYYHEIIGADVYTDTGKHLGKIKEILSPGANDVWVVKTGSKDLLLPVISDVVKKVDSAEKRIVVHVIPGLIDDED
ncbi:ribosome maturation factor RimM [Terrilactibacillus sp. S3-3]|nr:ribosome maturation factor RimM [Terrilactibacillus sp. S3-3]